jgi:signal transduction histidine kinase
LFNRLRPAPFAREERLVLDFAQSIRLGLFTVIESKWCDFKYLLALSLARATLAQRLITTQRLAFGMRLAMTVGGQRLIQALVLVCGVLLISIGHYVTATQFVALHNVYQRLYYLPIFAGAYWFGWRGALGVSLLSAAAYFPHIVHDWSDYPGYRQAQYAELLMFQVVGSVVGILAELEQRQRARQERTARELAAAYRQLQESFEHMRRADRLSALGQLSAGLAHEIKNPLGSIKGSLEIVAEDFPPDHKKREFIEILRKEIDRLNSVLTEFLHFARTPRPDLQRCDLRDVIDSIRVLCAKEAARQGVRIEVVYSGALPEVYADAAQIQQALLNLVLNGIQAMPGGGRLKIEAKASAGAVEIRIHDEGTGIPLEARSRIFEPFFTTKERGTGLGLAVAHKLIQGHHGEIRLLEQEGPGAVFLVILPLGRPSHEQQA